MIDIYCQGNKCPICDGKTEFDTEYFSKTCVNGCYAFQWNQITGYDVSIFIYLDKKDYRLIKSYGEAKYRAIEAEIRERIEYWKEDDRYLIRIIAGS